MAWSRRNPLALAVLTCLHERPMHPYEISQTLRHRAKHESIRLNYGSLYGVVESLEKKGLIRELETVREGRRPPRTVYEITDTGAREMTDWLSELVGVPATEYLQFEAGLALVGALPPEDALRLLQERAELIEVQLGRARAELRATAEMGLPRLFVLEGEYMLALQEAELEWVRRLIKDIEGGDLDGLEIWKAWYEGGGFAPDYEFLPRRTEPDAGHDDSTESDEPDSD